MQCLRAKTIRGNINNAPLFDIYVFTKTTGLYKADSTVVQTLCFRQASAAIGMHGISAERTAPLADWIHEAKPTEVKGKGLKPSFCTTFWKGLWFCISLELQAFCLLTAQFGKEIKRDMVMKVMTSSSIIKVRRGWDSVSAISTSSNRDLFWENCQQSQR